MFLALVVTAGARDFDPRRDGFAFANETQFAYGRTESGALQMANKKEQPAFKHRCMCMVRGTLQFWKFARFAPEAPRLTPEEYRRRLRQLFRISAWRAPRGAAERIVFPGYADLWSFSSAHRHLVQEEIGAWLLTYLRVGNWRMANPLTRLFQGSTAQGIARDLQVAPQAIFLAKWPSMNHAVFVFGSERLADGSIRFRVYDPNYPGQTARLDYRTKTDLFDFQERFYWPGGEVRGFRIYRSPWH